MKKLLPVLFAGALACAGATALRAQTTLYVAQSGADSIAKVTVPPGTEPTTFAANFDAPTGAAFDAAGNLYVLDAGAGVIDKIAPDGTVTTFANTGASSGTFITFSPAGQLYLSSFSDNSILRYDATGVPTVFASGLDGPAGLAFDPAGNLYVANNTGKTIDKITPDGTVTTFASMNLPDPVGLAFGGDGYLYVGNRQDGSLIQVSSSGKSTVALEAGTLNNPYGLATNPQGQILVVNSGDGTLVQLRPSLFGGAPTIFARDGVKGGYGAAFDAAGNLYVNHTNDGVVTRYPAPVSGTNFAAQGVTQPNALAFDPAGNLYVASDIQNTITKVAPDGTATPFASSGLSGPEGLVFDASGNLYVANRDTNTVVRFTPAGTATQFTNANLNEPFGLAFDSVGELFVSNVGGQNLVRFSPDGATSTVFASKGEGLDHPFGLAFDQTGTLSVLGSTDSVLRYAADGKATTVLDYPGQGFYWLATDGAGNSYVSSSFYGTVTRIAPDGKVLVVAQNLSKPFGIAFAPTSPQPSTFFTGQVRLDNGVDYQGVPNGVYYLQFPDGQPFGYYAFLTDPRYLYHFDLGYEYVFDAADGKAGVYFYDFASSTFFYTSPTFPFPYLYDFSLNTVLYYYPDPNNPGRYNTNGKRYFYNFATGMVITK